MPDAVAPSLYNIGQYQVDLSSTAPSARAGVASNLIEQMNQRGSADGQGNRQFVEGVSGGKITGLLTGVADVNGNSQTVIPLPNLNGTAAPTTLTANSTALTSASPFDFAKITAPTTLANAMTTAKNAHTPLDAATIAAITERVKSEFAPLLAQQGKINDNQNAISKGRLAQRGDAGFGESDLGQAGLGNVAQYGQTQMGQLTDKQNAQISAEISSAQHNKFTEESTLFNEAQTIVKNSQDQLNTQVDNWFKEQGRQNTITDNARQTLNTILTQFGGTPFKDLTPDEQTQLKNFANEIDPSGALAAILPKGMDTIADQKIAQKKAADDAANITKLMQLQINQQNANTAEERANTAKMIGLLRADIAASRASNSETLYTSKTIPKKLAQEITTNIKNGAKPTDIIAQYYDVNPIYLESVYKASNPNGDLSWITSGGN